MSKQKIPCGGFYIDDQTLQVKDGELTVIGDGLPNVTTDDNGDILAVVDGKWEKFDPNAPTPPIVVAETQTATPTQEEIGVSANLTPADYDLSSVKAGDILTASISGQDYVSAEIGVYDGGWFAYFYGDDTSANVYAEENSITLFDGGVFGLEADVPFTVEMTVTKGEPVVEESVFVVRFWYDNAVEKVASDKTLEEIQAVAMDGTKPIIGMYGQTVCGFVLSPTSFTWTTAEQTTGTIHTLTVEFEDVTAEPTGYWLIEDYMFSVGGGSSGALIIEESIAVANQYTKTYNEVYTAINNGTPCYVKKAVMATGKYGIQLAPVLTAYRDTSDPNIRYTVDYLGYDGIMYSLRADTQDNYLKDVVI